MNITKFQTPGAGIIIGIELTCEDLKDEPSFRFPNECSPGCKEQPKLFFRPGLRSSSIHASVCAGRFEFVRNLSREWWARKAAAVLGWTEDEIRMNIDEEWAKKVQRPNISRGPKWSSTGNSCVICGKPIKKGYDLCAECGEPVSKVTGPQKDLGSLEDLDKWD